jgi:MFS transporter, DHA3 family, macrolide efflux protein
VLEIKRFRGGPKVSATAAGSPVPFSLRDVLKISGFKRLWLAQLVSILGDFLAVFGVMIAFIIPMAIVGPLAG